MKIRNEKDREQLKERILNELGVDVTKYQDEEMLNNLMELLQFPQYVFTWVLRPVLIALAIYLIGFFVFDLAHIEYLFYGLIGFGLFLAVGLLLGLVFMMSKIRMDIWGVIDYTLEVMQGALGDIQTMQGQMSSGNRKESLGLLFQGIMHVVTIPMVSTAITNQVPFVGGLLTRFVVYVLTFVADKADFKPSEKEIERVEEEGNSAILEGFKNSIELVSNGLEKVLGLSFKIARFPFLIALVISSLLLYIFISILN